MRVEYSCVINAPIDKVWNVIRVYDKNWKGPEDPVKFAGDATGKAGDQVSALRTITLPDGGKIVERLEALDDINKRLCYAIVEAPFPCKNYVSEYQAFPVTEGNKTFVRWFSNFDPNADAANFDFKQVFSGIYSGMLQACAKIVE